MKTHLHTCFSKMYESNKVTQPPPPIQNVIHSQDAIAGRGSLTLGGIGELESDQGTLRRFARGRPRMVVAEEEDEEEDSIGYEDDFSIGIDLPLQLDVTSGTLFYSRIFF